MTDVASGRLYRARWAVGALTGVLLVWALALYSTHDVGATFSDLGETAVALLAAANCLLAARSSSGRLRVAWGALAGATLSWAVGQAVWTWFELFQHTRSPNPWRSTAPSHIPERPATAAHSNRSWGSATGTAPLQGTWPPHPACGNRRGAGDTARNAA